MKGYKTELEPNNKQASLFRRFSGASRYVYNWGLAEWKRQYEAGEKPSRFKLCKQFNAQKDELCPWIREIPYAVTEAAFEHLGKAFDNFFRRVKKGDTEKGYPKFKNRSSRLSFCVRSVAVNNCHVRLTGVGWARLKEAGYIPANAPRYGVYATISERARRWYISILAYDGNEDAAPSSGLTDEIIGVDIGIKSLAVFSDGTVYENPKPLAGAMTRLGRLQRELGRRTTGGENWLKTKTKVQKAHARVANIRAYALHQVSSEVIAKCPKAIVIEDLNVKGMVRNHSLARSISDASFGELRRQIEYKAKAEGIEVVIADRWFPSSKMCNVCGAIKDDLTLADRVFTCECGNVIDRDLNAARNLAAYGERSNRPGLPVELTGGKTSL